MKHKKTAAGAAAALLLGMAGWLQLRGCGTGAVPCSGDDTPLQGLAVALTLALAAFAGLTVWKMLAARRNISTRHKCAQQQEQGDGHEK